MKTYKQIIREIRQLVYIRYFENREDMLSHVDDEFAEVQDWARSDEDIYFIDILEKLLKERFVDEH